MKDQKKAILVILDGWGIGGRPEADAILQANTPVFDGLIENFPNATLTTFGSQVGLPNGQMGNSEVGHLNIGAGRIVYQDLERINRSVANGELENEKTIRNCIAYANENDKAIHILGLLSDGGVHAHIDHIIELASIFDRGEVSRIYVHSILDGRDTDPQGGKDYLKKLILSIDGTNASLGSIIGRYYAMDRDERWARIKKAYDLLIHGKGRSSHDPLATVQTYYQEGISDEFMEPIVVNDTAKIAEGDLVFFANFRTDRPRQLVRALSQEDFQEFGMSPLDIKMVTMTVYNKDFSNIETVFTKDELEQTLGEVLSKHNLSQLRIAETEKYPHVTFFFSGGREAPFKKEDRILIPSPKVATYDLAPQMSAQEVTDSICEALVSEKYEFVCLNYANADMVGHTGDFKAAVKAVETVDKCLDQLIRTSFDHGYQMLVIADHGNADCMFNTDNSPHTAHTVNPVPVVYISNEESDQNKDISDGILADIAPTILKMLGVDQPSQMTGTSLI